MKISAMMITRGRAAYAREAAECFMGQTYENKDLIILDDVEEPSFPDGIFGESVRYFTSATRTIGAKRNEAAALCDGDVIAHWDSDDLSAPNRLEIQLNAILETDRAVLAFNSMLFHEEQSDKWGRYVGYPGYAVGSSLMYRRDWWEKHPFIDGKNNVGEDNRFADEARLAGQLQCFDGGSMMVARVHDSNTSIKNLDHPNYRRVSPQEVPRWYAARKQLV